MRKEKSLKSFLFRTGILIKGVNGLIELISGFLIMILSSDYLLIIVKKLFAHELLDDANDFFANKILLFAQSLSFSTKEFIGIYIMVHGIINMALFNVVWNRKIKFYLPAILLLTTLTLYQIYRLLHTRSMILLIITTIDIAIVYFILDDYSKK